MMDTFQKAQPIWAAGREKEINLTCVFKARFSGNEPVKIVLTASCLYRLYVNGVFYGFGPARAAHGYFRTDEYRLNNLNNDNELAIEVAGYNTTSFYTLNQPSFLIAEVLRDDTVLRATGRNGDFLCSESNRVQKTVRFSYQRAFTEYYVQRKEKFLPVSVVAGGKYLDRGVDYAEFTDVQFSLLEGGSAVKNECREVGLFEFVHYEKQNIYSLEELERFPVKEVSQYEYTPGEKSCLLGTGQYGVWDFANSETGFIGLKINIENTCKFYVIFDEVNSSEDAVNAPLNISFTRNASYNVIGYELQAGTYDLLSFEPYTAKFIKIIVEEGKAEFLSVYVKTYRNQFFHKFKAACQDKKIALIVEAAARTFAHNAVDILTDCPSRERAGWLCDAFFSGRAERFFTGSNKVERNFLENYALAPSLENIPEDMIPMCYPSDIEKEMFIPNWALWYIVELYDYFIRTGDRVLVEMSKEKINGLLRYFKKFENEYGLLEDLENWVFIEWSKANDAEFIAGVNFPSNMLYAYALECLGKLYQDFAFCTRKAESIKEMIDLLSFNGMFYEDNAVRKEGKLTLLGHTSETCQYYAFYFGIARRENREELFKTLVNRFGPLRDCTTVFPDVYPSNAFIGNYLRLEILLKYGLKELVVKESVDYFYEMAKTTGTLWEHNVKFASLDHGFASYIAVLLGKCGL